MEKWMLKICESDRHKEPFVQHNSKYHCFVAEERDFMRVATGKSLCRKHVQDMDYESQIDETDIYWGNKILCQKCVEKYLKRRKAEEKL